MSRISAQPARPLDYSAAPARAPGSPSLHAIALLTAAATFPLIFLGGLVTSHKAGLSVPDWPNSYGYNMFLFPPSQWVGGVLFEHTHRLMATVVGFCSVVLTLWAWGPSRNPAVRRWIVRATAAAALLALLDGSAIALAGSRLAPGLRAAAVQGAVSLAGLALVLLVACFARTREPRRWVRWLAAGVLGMVLFQGLLGGLRVVLVQLDLAIVHACTAQAFFCLTASVAVVTSRWWLEAPDRRGPDRPGRRLVLLGAATVAAVYLQLIVGATMRHFDAGLAIPDLPLAYGKLLPPATADALHAVNHYRAFTLNLDPVTLVQIWLHFGHRVGAVLVSGFVIALAAAALRRRSAGLTGPAVLLLVLLAAQVTLGVLTVLLRKPADVASSHVAVGALVLVTSFVLTLRAGRRGTGFQPVSSRARNRRTFPDENAARRGQDALATGDAPAAPVPLPI